MNHKLPGILVTGASGFIGRNLLKTLKNDFHVFAMARRTQSEVGVARHQNIDWMLVDLAESDQVDRAVQGILNKGGIKFVIHLAGYYDFSYDDHPEYERTNVGGTANILEASLRLKPQRFIFASSLVVSEFSPEGEVITEKSPPDANFAYARSKRAGEEMCKEYAASFPVSVVRFAAIFSDWCEYGPLYMFLKAWLSKCWNNRILAGRGESAVTYLHVHCLVKLLEQIIVKHKHLPQFDIYLASPDRAISHRTLFQLSTRFYYGETRKPIHLPLWIVIPGIYLRDWLGRLTGHRPFERPWMARYIDHQFQVDASYTRTVLNWHPVTRCFLIRRLIFMIERLKSAPGEWQLKNEAAMKRTGERPNLLIAETLLKHQDAIINDILNEITAPENADRFKNYQKLDREKLHWYVTIACNLLMTAVRTGDRLSMSNYARFIAGIRIREDFPFEEISTGFRIMGDTVFTTLSSLHLFKEKEHLLRDNVSLTIQLAIDEIEDAYEQAIHTHGDASCEQ
ncbi:MAG: NAD-dependent epimerase/dehydratase family protein [Lentisphaeria bacterium]|nr:NAD-dependent epimerase/dehydratase family protein [Candidatus Neomarinimicrobiota bacterium]MCF7842324.1 NAD-dependent epimerase/dehydratase family protein [Lentisphaeria bacterium]